MGILKKENMKMNSVGGIWGKLLLCTATNDVPKCWVQNHFVCVLPPRNYALKITNNYLKFSFNLEWNPLHKHHSKRRGNMEKKDSHSPDRCSGGYFLIFPFSPWLWWYIWIQLIKFQLRGSQLFADTQLHEMRYSAITKSWHNGLEILD